MEASVNPAVRNSWLGLAVAWGAMGCSGGSSTALRSGGSSRDASPITKDAAIDMIEPPDAGGGVRREAGSPVGDARESAAQSEGGFPPACIDDNKPCDADTCCEGVCTNGACGGCRDEGTPCVQASDCCDNLGCTKAGDAGLSYCGTNLCAPTGTPCGGTSTVTCCDEACNNGTCGG
jgi:hypothetical protein